jgi:hypothetical protein
MPGSLDQHVAALKAQYSSKQDQKDQLYYMMAFVALAMVIRFVLKKFMLPKMEGNQPS